MTKIAGLTVEEQDLILAGAEAYIREPESWTSGKWKCELWEVDEKGEPIMGENGLFKQACNANGRPLFQYCIEGAVNQATVDVVGEERAIALGAVSRDVDGNIDYNNELDWREGIEGPTNMLGLDDLAYELYANEMGWTHSSEGRALVINDESDGEYGEDGHTRTLNLLRTARIRLRAALGS